MPMNRNKWIIAAVVMAAAVALIYWKWGNMFFSAFYTIGI